MNKLIPMSSTELQHLEIIHAIQSGRMKQRDAAARCGVSDRTIRRWIKRIEERGSAGLIHANRGKPSSRRLPRRERQRIVALLHQRYADFQPTFAAEKLSEVHGIMRDPKTIRTVMIAEGLWIPRRQRRGRNLVVHRLWRERKTHRGQLIQFDGSYHDWLEGRGGVQELCLLAAIDDATGEVLYAEFAADEGVFPVMHFWQEYMQKHGLPQNIYCDRFSTYKMTQQTAQENPDLKTQLERAMATLGVHLIFALSPQAKGRVERLFKTLQDRLVKELRLHKISSLEQANAFLQQHFLPRFNQKFSIPAQSSGDFHRTLSKREQQHLPQTLCRQEQRHVHNDFTVSFHNQWYQLLPTRGLAIRPKETIMVHQYSESHCSFVLRNRTINALPIPKKNPRLLSLRRQPFVLAPF